MSKRAMPGSASFASGSGATKSGMTNWSSESRVSRTSPRSEAVRRKRRSRVTGNELTPGWYAAESLRARAAGGVSTGPPGLFLARGRRRLAGATQPRAACPAAASRPPGGSSPISISGASGRPRLELDPLGEELPRGAPGGEQRQRDEDPREAVDLAAREQTEDHEQRVEAQRAAHHLRHDDVALELLDAEEEQRDPERRERMLDERVQHRRDRAEPRPDVRDELGDGRPRAERGRVLLPVREQADHPEDPEPEPDAHADDQREQELALARSSRPPAPSARSARRGRAAGSAGRRPPSAAACRAACRSRRRRARTASKRRVTTATPGPLGPAQRPGRVLLDVLRPDLVEELPALALDVDAAQVVLVEPALEAREILLGARPRRVSGIGRKVVVDPVGGACASAARPPWRERGSPVRRLLRRRDRRARPPLRVGPGPGRARGRAG